MTITNTNPRRFLISNSTGIHFDRPVQVQMKLEVHGANTEWYDCIITPDGKHIRMGTSGVGMEHDLGTFRMRNTPDCSTEAIDQWYRNAVAKLNEERGNRIRLNSQRWNSIVYQHPDDVKKTA